MTAGAVDGARLSVPTSERRLASLDWTARAGPTEGASGAMCWVSPLPWNSAAGDTHEWRTGSEPGRTAIFPTSFSRPTGAVILYFHGLYFAPKRGRFHPAASALRPFELRQACSVLELHHPPCWQANSDVRSTG